jgi:hypothetical protein
VYAGGGGGGGGFGSNGFITKAQLFSMDGHYETDITSGVGHPRLDSIVPLVSYTVACNDLGTVIILQVSQDNVNPAKNR